MNIQPLPWDTFKTKATALGKKIRAADPNSNFRYILAITRGGLIPAYFVAQQLNISVIKTICLTSYGDSRSQDDIKHLLVEGFTEVIADPTHWLVVDDIADSGATIAFVKQKYPGITTAAVYTKDPALCDHYIEHIPQDLWLDFPWETPRQ